MLADVPLSTLSSATCACASAGWTPSSVELSRHVRNVSLSLEDIILPPLCDGAVGFNSRHYSIASHYGWNFLNCKHNRIDLAFLSSRSEEHTSELQSLMRISYAVFCLKKKTKNINIL